jgi:hypothetical protein
MEERFASRLSAPDEGRRRANCRRLSFRDQHPSGAARVERGQKGHKGETLSDMSRPRRRLISRLTRSRATPATSSTMPASAIGSRAAPSATGSSSAAARSCASRWTGRSSPRESNASSAPRLRVWASSAPSRNSCARRSTAASSPRCCLTGARASPGRSSIIRAATCRRPCAFVDFVRKDMRDRLTPG